MRALSHSMSYLSARVAQLIVRVSEWRSKALSSILGSGANWKMGAHNFCLYKCNEGYFRQFSITYIFIHIHSLVQLCFKTIFSHDQTICHIVKIEKSQCCQGTCHNQADLSTIIGNFMQNNVYSEIFQTN